MSLMGKMVLILVFSEQNLYVSEWREKILYILGKVLDDEVFK